MSTRVKVIYSTFPSREVAISISQELLKKKLIVCANISEKIHSIYLWQGQIETASEETSVWFKTIDSCLPKMVDSLKKMHPYEVPCIIQLDPSFCLNEYEEWAVSHLKESD